MWFHVNIFLKPAINMNIKLQFKIRLDEDLHARIKQASEQNQRSVNTEIINRLEVSFIPEKEITGTIDAKQASEVAEQALNNGFNKLLSECMNQINTCARRGLKASHVKSGYDCWDDGDDIDVRVITPVKKKLEELGYQVEIEDLGFYIQF